MHIETDSKRCSGCSACAMICPAGAIMMCPDTEGFDVPTVSCDKCVDCGLCIRVCPAQKPVKGKSQMKAYAAKWKDEVRADSASGAFFPAVARFVLNLNGYVCGCVLDKNNLIPQHIVSNDWIDIQRMQDSKYVQSDMNDCYREIGTLLNEKKPVLFTGTSCQVAGLCSYLYVKRISKEQLITIDFFCHGVPSPRIWKEYLHFYEKEKGKTPIGYRFRSKQYGWGSSSRGSNYLNSITYRNTIQVVKHDNISWASRMWKTIFFSNLCIRRYCHSCPYANIEKPADFTMGDFWGIENFYPEFDDGKGCSAVLARTQKAQNILIQIDGLIYKEVALDEITKKQANVFAPSKVPTQRAEFWEDYKQNGFDFCARKYFLYTPKVRFKSIIARILFALKLRDI